MNCQSSTLEKFIDLGNQPNGNVFPTLNQLTHEQNYPFSMLVCTTCWQVQLEAFPPVTEMFTNHPYLTGLNKPVVAHYDQLAHNMITKFNLAPNSLVLDIGANDGTLLSKFRARHMRVLGIDPCERSYEVATAQGITILKAFWNKESARAMKELGITPDIITATAVFYHVDNLHSFVQGLDLLMEPHTIFCTQCVYLKEVIEKLQFDHFYHEHTMIHAIAPLKRLFSHYDLRIIDVEMYPIHGGSFVLYVGRENAPFPTTPNVTKAIEEEERIGLNKLQTYHNFTHQVNQNRLKLQTLLHEIAASGKRIFGLGAPLKSSTLLNYVGIDPNLVECVVEINEHKVGKFTPGTHIPIIHENEVAQHPDYYLILSWNFLDYFVDRYADYLEQGGKFIIPHPTVEILEK
ncbi:MAG: methyltransferase domain-containing protein [Flammeovirgaceae bacterium]